MPTRAASRSRSLVLFERRRGGRPGRIESRRTISADGVVAIDRSGQAFVQRRGQPLAQGAGRPSACRSGRSPGGASLLGGSRGGSGSVRGSDGSSRRARGRPCACRYGREAGDVADRRLLGVAEVGDERPGGLDLGAIVIDPEAGQGRRAEMSSLRTFWPVRARNPTTAGSSGRSMPGRGAPGPRERIEAGLRDQDFGRVEPGDLVEQLGPADAGQRKSAGRQLDPGQAELAFRTSTTAAR